MLHVCMLAACDGSIFLKLLKKTILAFPTPVVWLVITVTIKVRFLCFALIIVARIAQTVFVNRTFRMRASIKISFSAYFDIVAVLAHFLFKHR